MRASVKKFALLAHNTPNSAFLRLLGELFHGAARKGGVVLGEFCRTTSQVRPLLGGRHLRSNREPTCWDHHERMGMKKALPKDCLVEMQNPHRWIAPRGAAARPEGLEPPTF